jgi:hypothetical protein
MLKFVRVLLKRYIHTVSEDKKHLTNKSDRILKIEINCGHTVDIMEDKLLLGCT